MNTLALSGRARIVAALIGVAAIAAVAFTTCRGPDPRPIPVALQQKLDQHAIATAVDTSEINRLARIAEAADSARLRAERRSAAIARVAARDSARADSLAQVAREASTASDSARAWRDAYDARTAEADTLHKEVAAKDSALADARLQIAAVDSALVRSQARAARADSVIAAAVTVVRSSDPPCRLARFFSCPSRTEVALGAAAVGATAAVIGGKVKIKLPIKLPRI